MNTSAFIYLCAGLLTGAALGVGGYRWVLMRQTREKTRLPRKWPFASRVLMSNDEYDVLKWLRAVFHDHLVMVKLPVLRFTAPLSRGDGTGAHWQELLGGVYCTFTVCTPDGNVMGCVDVPGKRGLNNNNRQLKEALLSDCRIGYTVVTGARLPKAAEMRAAFLGELPLDEQTEPEVTRGGDSSFYAELESFTKEKRLAAKAAALQALNSGNADKGAPKQSAAGFNPDGTGAFDPGKSGKFRNQWEDSFIQPEESRPAKLN